VKRVQVLVTQNMIAVNIGFVLKFRH
jgi:hypothetical protein